MIAVKVLKQEGEEVVFIADKTNASFMNELRRAAGFEVPVLAIEDVYFVKNSSALYDEMLAHRLGLIPLKTNLRDYELPEDCSCKGKLCAKCSAKIILKAKGPCTVYAEDMKIKDPSVKAIYPKIPIVKLLEKQEIELEAVAILGRGTEHVKWSAGHAFYQHYPEIEISQKEVDAKFIAEHCPRKVFEVKGEKLHVANLENCNLCKSCEDRSNGAVKVISVPDKFIFTMESWGQMSPVKILEEAASIIRKKLKSAKL